MEHRTTLTICGAGPVGMALALDLIQRGVPPEQLLLIDAKSAEQAVQDPRSIALSYGSRELLERLDAWDQRVEANAIHDIHVSRRGHFGRTLITREEHQLPALGYVARYGKIVAALQARLSQTQVQVMRPARITSVVDGDDEGVIELESGDTVRAALAVQAEGGLFSDQAQKNTHRDYGQTALIAHVVASARPPHRAFERFTDDGPLALLPQDDGYSLVWCTKPERAELLRDLPEAQFLSELQTAFGNRVGTFTHASTRLAFVLGLNAQDGIGKRSVAIGNAAQTLHPVAGQGLNLGLRDATVLAKVLATDMSSATLTRFARQRKLDRASTVRLTDTMARIFTVGQQGSMASALIGASLALVDCVPLARNALAEHMLYGHRNQ